MCDMSKRPPIYRKLDPVPTPGTPITVSPASGYAACAVIEAATEAGAKVAWLRLYVSRDIGTSNNASAQYTPKGATTYWIVDFYDENSVDLCAVLAAIANGGGPGLPDPPIVWGTGTPN